MNYQYTGIVNMGDGPLAEFQSEEPIARVMGRDVRSFRVSKEKLIERIEGRKLRKADVSEEVKAFLAMQEYENAGKGTDGPISCFINPELFQGFDDDISLSRRATVFRVAE